MQFPLHWGEGQGEGKGFAKNAGSAWKPFWLITLLFFAFALHAAEVIPPAPQNHFNDYANVVSRNTAQQLDNRLTAFERETSSQIVVTVYPKMQTDSSIEDYCTRVYNAWKVGLKNTNNGAVLFVFIQDRKMRIQTGYGLEGALPDAICKRIIEDEIRPNFKTGNFDAGLTAGVEAMIQAARGEYKGSGRTVRDNQSTGPRLHFSNWIFIVLMILIFLLPRRRGRIYGRRGGYWMPSSGWGGGGWSGGGGGWSGGGGGGGSFSGGGGSSGGGGASGSW